MYQTVYYKLLSVRYVVIDSGCLLFGQQFDWRGGDLADAGREQVVALEMC